ncbi:hypothetical protein VitviT2T_023145 [Vitis vinifera]|uniref:RING-type E3 ubiquitin transferase n=1 Tax=Vitis vinifera TaxID=29760 RepID=A0ABY9DBX2_VITVI|nr:hypothetical protein VitviT2T_023145 [Vitis vinifera]
MADPLELAGNTVVSTVASAVTTHLTLVIAITITITFGYYRRKVLKRDHVFCYKPNRTHQQIYCVVCLCDAVEGERLRRLPDCKHCFHVGCIDAWFQAHSTCPLCRSQVSLPHRRQPTLFSHFLSLLKLIANKFGNPLCLEIPLALCDSLGYIP